MITLRRHRSAIGLFVAALLFAAAGLPGVLAAAQGMQLQAPLCGPAAKDLPTAPGPSADSHSDPCKTHPCGGVLGLSSRTDVSPTFVPYVSSGYLLTGQRDYIPVFRAELTPLNGRAPPPQG